MPAPPRGNPGPGNHTGDGDHQEAAGAPGRVAGGRGRLDHRLNGGPGHPRRGRLGEALPLWLLAAPLPAPAAVAVLGLAGLANGIRVTPLRVVTLLRIPPGLRVQAMTAESTLSTTAALLALALAGPALETLGTTPVLAGVAAVATTAAVSFATVAMRPDPAAQDG